MRLAVLVLALAIVGLPADWSSLYPTEDLEHRRAKLSQDLDLVVAQEIRPFLTLEQSHAFSKLEFDLPIHAANEANPLDFFSLQSNRITVPLLTIAFVEDMSEAYAWLWANHYSSRTVDEYFGMLRERAPEDFSEHRYPNPLVALHVPADALNDHAVAKMTLRVRATTLSFIVLHQFGHLSYKTSSEQRLLKKDPVEVAEELADEFALEVMKKNSETPAGLLMLVHGMIYVPAASPRNHPVSVERLDAMSDLLDLESHEFSEGRPDRRLAAAAIHSLANHIRQSAHFLADTRGQRLWAEQSRKLTIADLAPRHMEDRP